MDLVVNDLFGRRPAGIESSVIREGALLVVWENIEMLPLRARFDVHRKMLGIGMAVGRTVH